MDYTEYDFTTPVPAGAGGARVPGWHDLVRAALRSSAADTDGGKKVASLNVLGGPGGGGGGV